MTHDNLISAFEQIAAAHHVLRHGKPKSESDATLRKSFFYLPEQQADSINTDASYPCLVLLDYRGQLEDNSSVDDKMFLRFEVRKNVSDKTAFAAIRAAQSECKQIAMDIVAYLHRQMEDNPTGSLPSFDLNSVQYSFIGPVNDNEYGCYFTCWVEDEAFNKYTLALDEIFGDEPIVTIMRPEMISELKAGTWSLDIPAGKMVQYAIIQSQNNGTIKVGKTANGDELMPEIALTPGTAQVINLQAYYQTAGKLHFTTAATIDYKIYII